jgi:hypothetical protein
MNYETYKINMDGIMPSVLATHKSKLKQNVNWHMLQTLKSYYPHLHERYLSEVDMK